MNEGFVFNIEHNRIHDGPGIRTVVFMKGCPLECFWCQNPEGISYEQEVQYIERRCVESGACVQTCSDDPDSLDEADLTYHPDRCDKTDACVEACPSGALQYTGTRMTVDEVVDEVMEDRTYYETSGGGVTLSGGEPLVQDTFARELFERCSEAGVSTAVETCLAVPWENIEHVLPHLDLVMMDIKHIDAEEHRRATGAPNGGVLENAERIAESETPLIVRTPVVPGVNNSVDVIGAIAEFVSGFDSLERYELLPFHRLGESKYHSLGMEYPAADLESPSDERMESLAERARSQGVDVHVGEV